MSIVWIVLTLGAATGGLAAARARGSDGSDRSLAGSDRAVDNLGLTAASGARRIERSSARYRNGRPSSVRGIAETVATTDDPPFAVDAGTSHETPSYTRRLSSRLLADDWTGDDVIPDNGPSPVCGDGILNTAAGEQCETGGDCSVGEACLSCVCAASPGRIFSDDFDRPSLGPDWIADNLGFATSGGRLIEDSAALHQNGRLRWVGGVTDTVDQFGKLQVVDEQSHTWGFLFRGNGGADHYQVHLPEGSDTWRWERYDPDYADRPGTCSGAEVLSDGDWIGATIEGSGAATIVRVWRWGTDPDAGGAIDIAANWGPPDCTMTDDPPVPVDTGTSIGIRSYTGPSSSSALADNWSGGDVVAVSGTPAVCGDGVVALSEACDDGGESATCDADCTAAACGDGTLNVTAGELCESAGDCSAGEACHGCACVEASGQAFADDFDRISLGPDWVADSLSFDVSGNRLVENSGAIHHNGRLRWTGGSADTSDQYGKLRVMDVQSHGWGFMFRVNGAPGEHYQVHLAPGSSEWRWERYDPMFVDRPDSCFGDSGLADGDWIGATVEGTGNATTVRVWRWDSDPDAGGAIDIRGNWGRPDCTMTGNPSTPVDTGTSVGIRSYTGASTAASLADNWFSGDCGEGTTQGSCTFESDSPIVRIIDFTGDGDGNVLIDPDGVAIDSAGNAIVAGCGTGPGTSNVFRIAPTGEVTTILDGNGDGVNQLDCPVGVAVDGADNVFVVGFVSSNAFKVTPGGTITEIIDASGDGSNALAGTLGIVVDGADNVYVTGFVSDNAFRITPGGAITEIVDSSGDGAGNGLAGPFGIAVDGSNHVYVAGFVSDNVLDVAPGGAVAEIIGPGGDGAGNPLDGAHGVTVDGAGNVFVTGNRSDNVFRIAPGGAIREIIHASGDGTGNVLASPTGIAAGATGNVYVAAFLSRNAFEIRPDGTITQILDADGDGTVGFDEASDFCVAVDALERVYLASTGPETVFRVTLPSP